MALWAVKKKIPGGRKELRSLERLYRLDT